MDGELPLQFRIEDPNHDAVAALLARHLQEMHLVTPEGNVHAFDLEGLCVPSVTLFGVRAETGASTHLVACGALNELSTTHAELKSMHTHSDWRGHGIASRLVAFLVEEAERRGYERLSLETGAMESFAGARRLYVRHGFVPCGPFGAYGNDPNSAFMTVGLGRSRDGESQR